MKENSFFTFNSKYEFGTQSASPSAIVIDYDCYMAQNLAEILRLNGINVVAVGHSSKDAVQLYRKFEVNIVVIDLGTTWDGILAVEAIREINPKTLIVALAFTDDQRLNLVRQKASILFKPFDVTSFIEACRKSEKVGLMSVNGTK